MTRGRLVESAVALVAVVGLAVFATDNESHHGAKYLAWRYFRIGDWEYGARFLNVDPDFRTSFVGQPRATLLKWFPDLRPGASRAFVCPPLPQYEITRQEQLAGEWIGGTPWLVVYDQTGRVRDITMPKGC
jgi:hypothetical protein